MMYDSTTMYPMGYDPHTIHPGTYVADPTNMYLPQPSQNPSEVKSIIFKRNILLILFIN